MRITEAQKDLLVQQIKRHRPHAQIYLFGSRADDQARGGDIDILILDPEQLNIKELAEIERNFWRAFGEQKIDLVCYPPDSDHPFKQLALLKAIPLI